MENELTNTENVENTETQSVNTVSELEKRNKALEDKIAKLMQSVTNASADASKWKKEAQASKEELQSRMTEEERAKAEQEAAYAAMQERLATLEAERNVADFKSQFVSIGFEGDLAQETAVALNTGETAKLFSGIRKFVASHDKALAEKAMLNNPKLPGGNSTKTVTREEFDAMGYTEMVAFKAAHPDLYAEYMNKS